VLRFVAFLLGEHRANKASLRTLRSNPAKGMGVRTVERVLSGGE